MENVIVLITKEGTRIDAPLAFQRMSGFVRNVVEEFHGDIQLSVPKLYLDLILEYSAHHNYEVVLIDKPIPSNVLKDFVKDPWDIDFLQRVKREFNIFDLIIHVNYMDVGGLMELLFAYIASKFKGRDIESLKKKLKITEDFTEAEDIKMQRENPWTPS